MKKKLKILLGILLVCMLLSGCASESDTDKQEQPREETLEIGMCFDSFVIERWEKDRDVFVSTASALGAHVNVQNANGDVEKQIEQIKYFTDKKVDCLVVIPIDADSLSDCIKEAKDAGIKVISYDRILNNCNSDLYISFDNYMVGQMMGRAIVDSGARSALMICGPLTDSNVPMVAKGFRDVADSAGIDIVDTSYTEGWKAELVTAYVYDNGNKVRSADAIMCGNDDVATAVIRALAVSQLAGKKVVVGQDADLPACQHIVEGTQAMTVYKPVEKLAEKAANYAVALAKGESLDTDETISDGSYDIPYVAIEPISVNADNMEEVIIKGGFHTREDVYMNISGNSSR